MAERQSTDNIDDDYASSQDSDFAVQENDSSGSGEEDDDDDGAETTQSRRPRNDASSQPDEYDNSGDEAILKKGRKRRKIAQVNHGAQNDDDEGGLIKTRRQRAVEKEHRHATKLQEPPPPTFDVEAVFAEMLAESRAAERHKHGTPRVYTNGQSNDGKPAPVDNANEVDKVKAARVKGSDKARTEESPANKKGSEEANGEGQAAAPKRRVRRAFRSRFDPGSIDAQARRSDLDLGVAARTRAGQEADEKRLNVVERSRKDWATHVDEEGIRQELDEAEKAKDSYASKQEFLARRDAARAEVIKNSRPSRQGRS